MRIAAIGNYQAPWCTEVDLERALTINGHEVVEHQENDPAAWARLGETFTDYAFVLWTRTWDVPELADPVLAKIKGNRPIVGYHLDRWWGLEREREIKSQAFFRWCDVLCTADGGHDQQWADAGIRHWWYPPGVLGEEASVEVPPMEGQPSTPLVFVGSHRGYHREWPYRMQLVHWLKATYGPQISFFPSQGDPFEYAWRGGTVRSGQVRGLALNALYQNTPVVIGDSCLTGHATMYCSDRIPESVGRGALLVHPRVEGLGTLGSTFLPYTLGDFAELEALIASLLGDGAEVAQLVRKQGRATVLAEHTYERRLQTLVEQLGREGLL